MNFYTNVVLVGNEILSRGYVDGKHYKNREEFYPTLFVKTSKKTKYKTLEGNYVEVVKPGTIRETREFITKYENIDNFELYGNTRYINQYISEKYSGEIKFDITKIKLITIDIEVASENGFPDVKSCQEELLTISIQDYATKKVTTWGVKPFINKNKNVTYNYCTSEADLLDKFIFWWEQNSPEVVTGWNCDFYDIPYLYGRLCRVLGTKVAKQLSTWGIITEDEVTVRGRPQVRYDIAGLTILDYLELYRKFTYTNRESYRLDHIAEVELGQKKLDHSEYDTFKEFYTKDWQKFVEYNIVDVELVDRLEDKMKLIELAITMAYDSKGNYNDVFFQVRTWDSIIYNYLKEKNIVIPFKKDTKKDSKFAGAFVKEPVPGKYDWVVNFDLNSLYPHLLMMYNISPETLLEERHPTASVERILNQSIDFSEYKDYAICANGSMYRKDIRGFLPELMEQMYRDRVIYKKKMIEAKQQYEKTPTKELEKEIARCNNIQMAKKISLNSAYGAVGNEYFRYFKLANAEAVTLSGQVSIRWIENKLNQYMNKILKTKEVDYVIAVDTDSVYLNMGPLVETIFKGREKTTESVVSFLDKVCQVEFEKYIESCYQELAEYVNAYEQKMQMKRENIADRGIWTAKKRYILNVWNSEGVAYSEPKLKIMGLETAKSSTPAIVRTKLKDSIKIILTKTPDDLREFADNFNREFMDLSLEDIAFPRGVKGIAEYSDVTKIYKKGTPIHTKAALIHNAYIKKLGIDKQVQAIQENDKMKYIFTKVPNPYGIAGKDAVIGFIGKPPKEFNLEKYTDKNKQFEKTFQEPLDNILKAIGWSIKQEVTLESFFV